MSGRQAYAGMLVAAVLIAAAGPAAAKSQVQQQTASSKAEPKCNRVTPPFMYNPRYMNRGFFKASKCRKLKTQ